MLQGAGGVPKILFTPNLIFLWLKTPKIWEPYDNSFWEKSNPAEREIVPLIVDTKFRDSARKPLGPTK